MKLRNIAVSILVLVSASVHATGSWTDYAPPALPKMWQCKMEQVRLQRGWSPYFHCDYTTKRCVDGWTSAWGDVVGVIVTEDRMKFSDHISCNSRGDCLHYDEGVMITPYETLKWPEARGDEVNPECSLWQSR